MDWINSFNIICKNIPKTALVLHLHVIRLYSCHCFCAAYLHPPETVNSLTKHQLLFKSNLWQSKWGEGRCQLPPNGQHRPTTEDGVDVHEDILHHDGHLHSCVLQQLFIIHSSKAWTKDLWKNVKEKCDVVLHYTYQHRYTFTQALIKYSKFISPFITIYDANKSWYLCDK